jgi:hypothetical protein
VSSQRVTAYSAVSRVAPSAMIAWVSASIAARAPGLNGSDTAPVELASILRRVTSARPAHVLPSATLFEPMFEASVRRRLAATTGRAKPRRRSSASSGVLAPACWVSEMTSSLVEINHVAGDDSLLCMLPLHLTELVKVGICLRFARILLGEHMSEVSRYQG